MTVGGAKPTARRDAVAWMSREGGGEEGKRDSCSSQPRRFEQGRWRLCQREQAGLPVGRRMKQMMRVAVDLSEMGVEDQRRRCYVF